MFRIVIIDFLLYLKKKKIEIEVFFLKFFDSIVRCCFDGKSCDGERFFEKRVYY